MKNEKEPVIIIEDKNDIIVINKVHKYSVNLTLGLADGNDFYLEINFKDLLKEDFEHLIKLGNEENRLEFTSNIIKNENYNITHIVIIETFYRTDGVVVWKCLSDDPKLYEMFEK